MKSMTVTCQIRTTMTMSQNPALFNTCQFFRIFKNVCQNFVWIHLTSEYHFQKGAIQNFRRDLPMFKTGFACDSHYNQNQEKPQNQQNQQNHMGKQTKPGNIKSAEKNVRKRTYASSQYEIDSNIEEDSQFRTNFVFNKRGYYTNSDEEQVVDNRNKFKSLKKKYRFQKIASQQKQKQRFTYLCKKSLPVGDIDKYARFSKYELSILYRSYSRLKYRKYRYQFPRMRQSELISKIIKRWQAKNCLDLSLTWNKYLINQYLEKQPNGFKELTDKEPNDSQMRYQSQSSSSDGYESGDSRKNAEKKKESFSIQIKPTVISKRGVRVFTIDPEDDDIRKAFYTAYLRFLTWQRANIRENVPIQNVTLQKQIRYNFRNALKSFGNKIIYEEQKKQISDFGLLASQQVDRCLEYWQGYLNHHERKCGQHVPQTFIMVYRNEVYQKDIIPQRGLYFNPTMIRRQNNQSFQRIKQYYEYEQQRKKNRVVKPGRSGFLQNMKDSLPHREIRAIVYRHLPPHILKKYCMDDPKYNDTVIVFDKLDESGKSKFNDILDRQSKTIQSIQQQGGPTKRKNNFAYSRLILDEIFKLPQTSDYYFSNSPDRAKAICVICTQTIPSYTKYDHAHIHQRQIMALKLTQNVFEDIVVFFDGSDKYNIDNVLAVQKNPKQQQIQSKMIALGVKYPKVISLKRKKNGFWQHVSKAVPGDRLNRITNLYSYQDLFLYNSIVPPFIGQKINAQTSTDPKYINPQQKINLSNIFTKQYMTFLEGKCVNFIKFDRQFRIFVSNYFVEMQECKQVKRPIQIEIMEDQNHIPLNNDMVEQCDSDSRSVIYQQCNDSDPQACNPIYKKKKNDNPPIQILEDQKVDPKQGFVTLKQIYSKIQKRGQTLQQIRIRHEQQHKSMKLLFLEKLDRTGCTSQSQIISYYMKNKQFIPSFKQTMNERHYRRNRQQIYENVTITRDRAMLTRLKLKQPPFATNIHDYEVFLDQMERWLLTKVPGKSQTKNRFILRRNVYYQGYKFPKCQIKAHFLNKQHLKILKKYQTGEYVLPVKKLRLADPHGNGLIVKQWIDEVGTVKIIGKGLQASRNIRPQELVSFFAGAIVPITVSLGTNDGDNHMQFLQRPYIGKATDVVPMIPMISTRQPRTQTRDLSSIDCIWSTGPMINCSLTPQSANLEMIRVWSSDYGIQYLLVSKRHIKQGQHFTWWYNPNEDLLKDFIDSDNLIKQIRSSNYDTVKFLLHRPQRDFNSSGTIPRSTVFLHIVQNRLWQFLLDENYNIFKDDHQNLRAALQREIKTETFKQGHASHLKKLIPRFPWIAEMI